MTKPVPDRQRQLDSLITELANKWMGVPFSEAQSAMEQGLARLLEFFGVDQTFLRRNDHDAGLTILRAEWPPREEIPDPDPLYAVPFTADPVFGQIADLKEAFISYPKDAPDYQERIKAGSGQQLTTLLMSPILTAERTIGTLGIIRHSEQLWTEAEVSTIGAISGLIGQLWGRHDAEAQVNHLAFHDELTNLPNRRLITGAVQNLDPDSEAVALVIDIDNMNGINDGLTFDAGNQYLVGFAEHLQSLVRPDSMVARLGGDQFAVLSPETDIEAGVELAKRLVVDLAKPIHLGDTSVSRSVSVGISPCLPDRPDRDALGDADVAMFNAKKAGKNRFSVFDEKMQVERVELFEIELELRKAIEAKDELLLHYQPEVDLQTGQIVAVEALVRWNHPHRGLLSAGVFIEAAEESGLIVDIGDFVLREAVSQLAAWKVSFPDLVMRINISPAQIMSRDLVSQVRQLIGEFKVDPSHLCIEVTEHVMLTDYDFVSIMLEELRLLGVTIALDDFGTGYSSMKQLKALPIDALKIDIAFIRGLGVCDRDSAIVDATIRLADAFGLATVAEGIEEEHQVVELLKRGCTRAQGFLLAKPQDPETLTAKLGESVLAGSLDLAKDLHGVSP